MTSAEEVLAASAAWVYVPEDAEQVRTDEYHLVAYPLHWSDPTAVTSIASDRTAAALVDEVLDRAAALGRDAVTFWITGTTRPADLEAHLRERGAEPTEHLDVLARPLDALPDLDVPADVDVRRVVDEASWRDAEAIGVEVFGGSFPDDEAVAAAVGRIRDAAPQFVAYRDGRPLGTAGASYVDGVARLWGGGVRQEARGTGLYRALLDVRLQAARAAGCRFALVKGRVETSGPVLRRAGFERYGGERAHLLRRG
ncbi:GNAT family N-acetyltransferase [Nocardioides anomalus]|uniref:GNAT family N-acetyltransferase n=1 Tax=Nocardioides anomalus TaxID=2712223 RepID=A0A6G6W957_9ACTN|nr:GNAT family N-acetyltransferase [Nocardioides anomalus]QIG41635.1 GNAT family N-acetyltransferase [Nocardioides anomalus]